MLPVLVLVGLNYTQAHFSNFQFNKRLAPPFLEVHAAAQLVEALRYKLKAAGSIPD
jgi:hypothetical protein